MIIPICRYTYLGTRKKIPHLRGGLDRVIFHMFFLTWEIFHTFARRVPPPPNVEFSTPFFDGFPY